MELPRHKVETEKEDQSDPEPETISNKDELCRLETSVHCASVVLTSFDPCLVILP